MELPIRTVCRLEAHFHSLVLPQQVGAPEHMDQQDCSPSRLLLLFGDGCNLAALCIADIPATLRSKVDWTEILSGAGFPPSTVAVLFGICAVVESKDLSHFLDKSERTLRIALIAKASVLRNGSLFPTSSHVGSTHNPWLFLDDFYLLSASRFRIPKVPKLQHYNPKMISLRT